MLRVKGSDTLCPLGPGLVDDWDFHGKRIRTLVNGEVRQDGSTDEMLWDMHYLVADIARTITLVPGDVILSGTPANSRPVEPGDVVEVEVEGLGSAPQHDRRGRRPDPRGRRRPAERVRGGRLDGVRRRLGVPRGPVSEEGLMDLEAHLRSHAFMKVERPPLMWSPDTEDEPFLLMLGEMIALGLGRGTELADLTLNISNVTVDPDAEDDEGEAIPDGDYVAVTVRGAGVWEDDLWRAGQGADHRAPRQRRSRRRRRRRGLRVHAEPRVRGFGHRAAPSSARSVVTRSTR